jgi:hypothetical protein
MRSKDSAVTQCLHGWLFDQIFHPIMCLQIGYGFDTKDKQHKDRIKMADILKHPGNRFIIEGAKALKLFLLNTVSAGYKVLKLERKQTIGYV